MSILRDVQRKKRGRPPRDYGPQFYTGCCRKVRYSNGVRQECGCKSCKAGGW